MGAAAAAENAAHPKMKAMEWVPLPHHPVFPFRSSSSSSAVPTAAGGGGNIAAWHAESSRLYLWEPEARCVHRLSLRFSDPALLEAASHSERLVPDIQLHSAISRIELNADGSSLLLYGSEDLCVMYLYERTSLSDNTSTCRTVLVGSQVYCGYNNGLRTLQVSWHPYSSTHLGILSSDSVFRLFDLSTDLEQPEQEYYLQPVEPTGRDNAVAICPVAFSFGGHHLWDRFSVFVLFSDGSVYVLCPIVPFGSSCSWAYIEGIYEDVNMYGLKSSNSKVVKNSSLAITWLEATFPELAERPISAGNILASRAHPYAPLDASLSLQGPLRRIFHAVEHDDSKTWNADCEGKAVGFLYSSIGKDSVIVIAWSSGQLQVDALADEVQPFWNVGSCSNLRVGSYGRILGVAMICEPTLSESSRTLLSQPPDGGTSDSNLADVAWLGHPPPLLRLAIVDLALPNNALKNSPLSLFTDPLILERFYCLHGGGIDLIALHFLPFSKPFPETDKIAKCPSVYPILNTCHGESCSPCLRGFATIADSFGHSQIVGITSSCECIVLETMNWNEMLPLHLDIDVKSVGHKGVVFPEIISKELLSGPRVISIPHSTSSRSFTADSVEGRSILHHYIKLFHENYVEYAHKVYIELKQHGNHVKIIMDGQHRRLDEAKKTLSNLKAKQEDIKNRVDRVFDVYGHLEQRLQRFKGLPGANKKPLSRAELEFKAQLDRFANLELDALHSSIDALHARLKRYIQSSPRSAFNTKQRGKIHAPDSQMSQLKSSLGVLSNINTEITEKLKLLECELDMQEK